MTLHTHVLSCQILACRQCYLFMNNRLGCDGKPVWPPETAMMPPDFEQQHWERGSEANTLNVTEKLACRHHSALVGDSKASKLVIRARLTSVQQVHCWSTPTQMFFLREATCNIFFWSKYNAKLKSFVIYEWPLVNYLFVEKTRKLNYEWSLVITFGSIIFLIYERPLVNYP